MNLLLMALLLPVNLINEIRLIFVKMTPRGNPLELHAWRMSCSL